MKRIILLVLTLILGLAARWYKIENPVADWHSWRQADTASVSHYYIQHGIDLLVPHYQDISSVPSGKLNPQGYRMVEFPIYNAFHASLAKNLPFWSIDKWGRALSAFISLFSIVFLFLILELISGPFVAHVAAFFMAVLPFNIYYSRVILPEPLMLAYLLAGTYYTLKFLNKPRRLHFFLASSLLALSLLIKPYAVFFMLPLFSFAINKFSLKIIKSRYFYLFICLVILPLLLWRFWINQFPEGVPATSWLYNVDGIRFRPAWFRWLFGERLAKLILGSWGIVLLSIGLLARSTKKENWTYHLWFLGILSYLAIFAGGNVRHDYYQAITTPFLIAILSRGFVTMFKPNRFLIWPITPILAVFCAGMMLFLSWYDIRGYYQINNGSIIHAGQAADKLLPVNAKVVAPYNGDTAFLYQTKRQGWPLVTTNILDLITDGATHYVSTTYDKFTAELMTKPYITVLEKNPEYVILELHKP